MKYSHKQRLTYFLMICGVTVLTHFAYRYFNPEWISYRYAEKSYAEKNWDQAIRYYNESVEQGIKNPYVYSKLGDVYSKTKNFPMAVKSYEKYLELRPQDLWAMRAYAGVLTANGEFDRAAQEYQKVLEEEQRQKEK